MFTITPIVASSFISMVVYIIITIIAWQRRQGSAGYYFAMMVTCQAFWTAMVTFGYASTPVSLKIFFAVLDAWGYTIANVFFSYSPYHLPGTNTLQKKAG